MNPTLAKMAVLSLALMMIGGAPAARAEATKQLALRDGTLYIDGRPAYVRGIGFYDLTVRDPEQWQADLARYRSWGMNLIEVFARPGTADAFGRFLTAAQQAGLYVAAEFDNNFGKLDASARRAEMQLFLAFGNRPNLVAWLLRDDTNYAQHYTILLDMKQTIRRVDPATLITTTMLEQRVPDRLTPAQWADWAALLDFPTPYDYPVLRDGSVFAPMSGTQGGLDTPQILADRTRTLWHDPNLYMWQWVQSHSQRATIRGLDFQQEESYTTTPDQLRLLTYQMLAGGIKGLLYYRDRFFEDPDFGVGRRNELQLMWTVLGQVDDFLAAGTRTVVQRPSGDGVEVVRFTRGDAQLVLLVQHRYADVRYVGHGRIEPQRLDVPVTRSDERAYLLTPAGVSVLPGSVQGGVLTVEVPALELSGTLLVTADAARAASIDAALKAELPASARAAVWVLADTLAKVEAVSDALPVLAETKSVLADAHAAYTRAGEHLAAGAWAAAYQEARAPLESLRQLAQAQLDAAEHASPAPGERKYLASYFSLPKYYGDATPLAPAVERGIGTLSLELLHAEQGAGS